MGALARVVSSFFDRVVCAVLFPYWATVARLHRLRTAVAGPDHQLFFSAEPELPADHRPAVSDVRHEVAKQMAERDDEFPVGNRA